MDLAQHIGGETIQVGRNQPFWLDDPESIWLVLTGKVDLFIVPKLPDGSIGARTHFLRAEQNNILMGIPLGPSAGINYLAAGTDGTSLIKFPAARLKAFLDDTALAPHVDQWLNGWIDSIYQGLPTGLPPKHVDSLEPETQGDFPADLGVRAEAGLVWMRIEHGTATLAGLPELALDASTGWVPVTASGWIYLSEPGRVLGANTAMLARDGVLWDGLARFYTFINKWAIHALKIASDDEKKRLSAKSAAEQGALNRSLSHLSNLLADPNRQARVTPDESDPLLAACTLIGGTLGIPIRADLKSSRTRKNPLAGIAKASRFRLRRVVLSGEWWRQDGGPILAYLAEKQDPVALIPTSSTSYVVINTADGSRLEVTADVAQIIAPVAYTFYRPFPDTALKMGQIIEFGLQDAHADIFSVIFLGFAGALLGMLVPVIMGIIFESIIPSAAGTQLFYIVGGLLVISFASVAFAVTREIALLRVGAKSDASIQGAVWDRLLSLPLPFFRNYTSGDLAVRAGEINQIHTLVFEASLSIILGGMFAILNLGLMIYFNLRLGLLAVGLMLLHVGLSVVVCALSLRFQRPLCEIQGKISGQVLQFITGISKLRVAGAEIHAYSVWARSFAAQKQLHLRSSRLFNAFAVASDIYPLLTSLCLFAAIAFWTDHGMSAGKFLAFTAAFATFLQAMLEISESAISILHAIPIYERARPILQTRPEITETKADPGELTGRIELSHIFFRYKEDGPLVLHDISFQINPGEFVAIVGPSGSGKSTLLRLLLGFDSPESGTIYFDGLDLTGLDVQAVRRQFGVVLQGGKLIPGDIYQNIIGSSQLSIDDAWEAARKAGLDEDVQEMPMGMHTVLSEGAGTLSGGQRQRLMIARAIVAKPRILLFDEATSALENRTQAIVSRSLEKLQATRVVIAHRLSTIINADRILVIQAGRLVQSGNYNQLIHQQGPFAELARRQFV